MSCPDQSYQWQKDVNLYTKKVASQESTTTGCVAAIIVEL